MGHNALDNGPSEMLGLLPGVLAEGTNIPDMAVDRCGARPGFFFVIAWGLLATTREVTVAVCDASHG